MTALAALCRGWPCLVLCAAALAIAASPARAAERPCVPFGATAIADAPGAVVTVEATATTRRWHVCNPATGARALVAEGRADGAAWPDLRPIATAGPWVAFVETRRVSEGTTTRVLSWVDVRDPDATLRRLDVGEWVVEVAIDPTGRVAFLTETELRVVDAAGTGTARIDRAVGGQLSDLEIVDDRLSWRHGGVERAAPLDAAPSQPAPAQTLPERPGSRFDVMADGTAIEIRAHRLLAHPLDGAPHTLVRTRRRIARVALDDLLGRVGYKVQRGRWWRTVPLRAVRRYDRCIGPDERVLVDAGRVLVVTERGPFGDPFRSFPLIGCVLATGRRTTFLTTAADGGGAGGWAVAGTVVAFQASSGSRYDPDVLVGVVDLATEGKPAFGWLAAGVTDLDVDKAGHALARTSIELRLVDHDGARLLDAAVPGSLQASELDGGVARWTHAGEARELPAALPEGCAVLPPGAHLTGQSAATFVAVDNARPAAAFACRVADDRWTALGSGSVQAVGRYVAIARPGALEVLGADTLGPARPPIAVESQTWSEPWALGADGSVVLAPYDRTPPVLHRLDGTHTAFPARLDGWFAIDERAHAVVGADDFLQPYTEPLPE